MLFRILSTLLMCAWCAVAAGQNDNGVHQQSEADGYQWPTDALVLDKLQQWQDLKFGVLLHWGIYSVPGIVESWSICCEDWIRRDTTRTYDQYKQWYFGLADEFNPTRFDPAQWATVMQDAGMKYMIFTTKHHDGFCLWDTRQTDYSIARHAFAADPRRDVLRHVLQAFGSRHFMLGTYFSKPDWHSQLYWWDVFPNRGRNVTYPIAKHRWRWEQFCQFTHRQVEEIMTGYGPIDILWLDGGWVCPENGQDIHMARLATMARSHQPGLIVVDRTVRGSYENYQTPERAIPDGQLPYPWESCIPLSDDWGWVPRPRWKSPRQVVNTLVEVVAKGGNLLLGVGPTPEGLIQPEAVEHLHAIGQWLRANGQAIYGTTITPHYHEGDLWFTAAPDGRRRYAILALPPGQPLPQSLSWTEGRPVRRVRLLATGQKLRHSMADGHLTVWLPSGLQPDSYALAVE